MLGSGALYKVPKVTCDGKTIAPPVRFGPYQMVWIWLPFGLMASGGALGAGIGGFACMLNSGVFRARENTAATYMLAGGITHLAVVCYAVSAFLVGIVFRR